MKIITPERKVKLQFLLFIFIFIVLAGIFFVSASLFPKIFLVFILFIVFVFFGFLLSKLLGALKLLHGVDKISTKDKFYKTYLQNPSTIKSIIKIFRKNNILYFPVGSGRISLEIAEEIIKGRNL
jgi:hypothetical protein